MIYSFIIRSNRAFVNRFVQFEHKAPGSVKTVNFFLYKQSQLTYDYYECERYRSHAEFHNKRKQVRAYAIQYCP